MQTCRIACWETKCDVGKKKLNMTINYVSRFTDVMNHTTHGSSRNLSSAFYYIRLPTLLTVNGHVTCEILNSSHTCVKCNQNTWRNVILKIYRFIRSNNWEVLKVWNHSFVYLFFVTLSSILLVFFCSIICRCTKERGICRQSNEIWPHYRIRAPWMKSMMLLEQVFTLFLECLFFLL